jgi:hypothetical protein
VGIKWRLAGTVVAAAVVISGCGGGSSSETVAATAVRFACPRAAFPPAAIGSKNANPHAQEATVPGQPDRVLLCRYFGQNQGPRPGDLASKWSASRGSHGADAAARTASLETLVTEMNETSPFLDESHTCPMDEGVAIYALFHYPAEPPVLVDVRPGGCGSVTNGQAEGGEPHPGLIDRLEHLVPLGD